MGPCVEGAAATTSYSHYCMCHMFGWTPWKKHFLVCFSKTAVVKSPLHAVTQVMLNFSSRDLGPKMFFQLLPHLNRPSGWSEDVSCLWSHLLKDGRWLMPQALQLCRGVSCWAFLLVPLVLLSYNTTVTSMGCTSCVQFRQDALWLPVGCWGQAKDMGKHCVQLLR